jgi:Methyltransferase FkbM domain
MMNIHNLAKSLVRKPLNAVGLNVVRLADSTQAKQFAPTEATRFLWLTSLGLRTVFDVGAHAGEFARMMHKILPGVAIISFEPLAEPFERLQRNMGGIPNFRAFNCALGAENSTQEMHHNASAHYRSEFQGALRQHVRKKGFKYMGNFDQLLSPADGSVLQADAIFIRQ